MVGSFKEYTGHLYVYNHSGYIAGYIAIFIEKKCQLISAL